MRKRQKKPGLPKDDEDLFLDHCIAENEKLISEQQKFEESNSEVSKQVKIAEDVIIEYRERFLLLKQYEKVKSS